jgi:ribosomal protein L29
MAEVSDAREALRKFQFQMAGGKAKNVREGRALKKQIARVLTEMNKRKIQKANSKV